MRCRGLTGPQRATDLPIPRLIRALPDRHPANSPYAIPGPPASRRLSGLPPRWPAVQVVNEFVLPARAAPQGLSVISSRLFCYPQHADCYPPPSPLIHRIPTVFAQPLCPRPACLLSSLSTRPYHCADQAGWERVMTEIHVAAGADSTPGTSGAPSAPLPDTAADFDAAPVPPLPVLGLWLLQQSHRTRTVNLPGTLLGLGKETGPNAQAVTDKIVAKAQATAGNLFSHPAAASYGGAGGWFTVIAGVPQPGNVMPMAQQVVQRERANGYPDAAAFPPGRSGGILTCLSYPAQSSRPVQCSWIDEGTAGQVVFDPAYTSNLAHAAAITRHLRDAIGQ